MSGSPRDQSAGSITVVIAVAISFVVLVAAVAACVVAVFASQVKASQAADLAALAGAQHSWLDQSAACPAAQRIATEHVARLVSCSTDAFDVQVQVAVALPAPLSRLGTVTAEARAGPPE